MLLQVLELYEANEAIGVLTEEKRRL